MKKKKPVDVVKFVVDAVEEQRDHEPDLGKITTKGCKGGFVMQFGGDRYAVILLPLPEDVISIEAVKKSKKKAKRKK